MKKSLKCPRCGGGIPNDINIGAYPGALSRTDNKTEICSECGVLEGLEQMVKGQPDPQDTWLSNTPAI
jgi:ribosomal protein S27AE